MLSSNSSAPSQPTDKAALVEVEKRPLKTTFWWSIFLSLKQAEKHWGNTQYVAQLIQPEVEDSLFRIETVLGIPEFP